MLENLFGEGKTKVAFFILGIVGNAWLGVWNGEAVVLEFDMGERSIGIVDGKFVLGDSRTLSWSSLDCLSVQLDSFLELIVL